MHQIALPELEAIVRLTPCQAPPPVPVVTTVAPVREHQSLYIAAGACLYALHAADGTARWWTPTDAQVAAMPFMDWAVPLVQDSVVYSGTYALNAQDGAIRWRIAIDTLMEGAKAPSALSSIHVPLVFHG